MGDSLSHLDDLLTYTYKYCKKDATTFSRQACFVNRFTLQGINERIFM